MSIVAATATSTSVRVTTQHGFAVHVHLLSDAPVAVADTATRPGDIAPPKARHLCRRPIAELRCV
ncbi:hypothetical protein CfE428DRAFT_6670 [Chthoniobacter flavus Ellin428]|uniref:Uncharacterized protein n=2 Tax=Chthoniobacter flavus TaxID=191863 RepID=B4DCM9_9BACT|nr:hypothetical protein CfE428DRAFT_6670 [Chthoniobacter flavus Ellin428]